MKKNRTLLISIILLCVTVALAVAVTTYAVWERQAEDFIEIHIPTNDFNPSEKYIVYKGLDASGNFTDEEGSITAYAVVGYSGLVAELVIPETHNELPVTKISSSSDQINTALAGNQIITSITIPGSVVQIDQGVCANILRLKSVKIQGTEVITIQDLAFAGCVELTEFECEREIDGTASSYLYNTPRG